MIFLILWWKVSEKKYIFMESKVLKSKKILAFKIINSITLLPKRISNENATWCLGIKFVIGGEIGGIV